MPVMLIWQAPAPTGRGGPGAPPAGPGRGAPPAPAERRFHYGDYRAVNAGQKWPAFRIRHAVAGATIEEMTFDRVSINAKIDPKKFEAAGVSTPAATAWSSHSLPPAARCASPSSIKTNAVVVGATSDGVTGADDTTRRVAVAPTTTTDAGVATIPDLPPGRYTIDVEFPGFEKRTIPDVRIRAGDSAASPRCSRSGRWKGRGHGGAG